MAAPNKTKPIQARRPVGRPKGSLCKKTIERRQIFEAASKSGETPLEYFLRIMRAANQPCERRDWAAHAAAPYMHPRLMPLMSAPQRKADDTASEIRAALSEMRKTTVVPPPPAAKPPPPSPQQPLVRPPLVKK